MAKYIIKRLLESIPLLLLVSIIIFVLLQLSGDPLATLGGRTPPRADDVVRLRKALGLDQPIYMQYIFWLAGNDWYPLDLDGDGIADPLEERKSRELRYGVIRGDFGKSIATRQPAMEDNNSESSSKTTAPFVVFQLGASPTKGAAAQALQKVCNPNSTRSNRLYRCEL